MSLFSAPTPKKSVSILEAAENALACLDNARTDDGPARGNFHEHARDLKIDSNEAYEFNVRMRGVDIPSGIRDVLSEDRIDDIVNFETENELENFRAVLREKYPWIGEVGLVGRSAGWLIIQDKEWSYDRLEEAIKEYELEDFNLGYVKEKAKREGKDFLDEVADTRKNLKDAHDALTAAIGQATRVCQDIGAIQSEVGAALLEFERLLESEDFWKPHIEQEGEDA